MDLIEFTTTHGNTVYIERKHIVAIYGDPKRNISEIATTSVMRYEVRYNVTVLSKLLTDC